MKIFSFNSLLYELHYLRGSGTRGYGSYLLFFDSLGLITLNTSLEKKLSQWGSCGESPKWNRQKKFRQCFRKNTDCGKDMDDKHKFIFAKQISDNLQSVRDRNRPVGYMRLPITAPSNKLQFWQFFEFSGKTRDIFRKYFLILCPK